MGTVWLGRLRGAGPLGWALVVQLFVSCGGNTSSRQPNGNPPVTTGGTAGASSSGVAGATGTPYPNGCQPMDARASGELCAGSAGYRWNGELCEGIACACVGSDCGRAFVTMEDCDRAHRSCYAAQGIMRHCAKHSDCSLRPRTCCPTCGVPTADSYIALARGSLSPAEAMTCLGDRGGNCSECESGTNPSVYPVCIDAQCTVVDVAQFASCLIDTDCRLVTKDCCDCGGDFTQWGVMSVNHAYVRPQRCEGVGCDGCIPKDPSNIHALCRTDRGVCDLITDLQ